MATGILISFEGIDGCGKSTQLSLLVAWLRKHGVDPLVLREPGGTPLGEQLRDVLLDPATGNIAGSAEALLYAASRAQLLHEVVRPALAAGRIVLADRYVDSSMAYQGAGRGLGIDDVLNANRLAIGDLMPARTVLLRVDEATSAQRRAAAAGADDRIESAGAAFFSRVATAYDELAIRYADRFVVIDGTQSPDAVFAEILTGLQHDLQPPLPTGAAT